MIWTEDQDSQLRFLAGETHLAAAAREMQLPLYELWHRARRLKIRAVSARVSREPSQGEWIFAAQQEATAAGVEASLVLGGCRSREVVRARWAAWKKLLSENPQFSIAGLSRVSGFDHSSILFGLRRLSQMEAAE